MKRNVLHIVLCICCILISVIGLLYGFWDNQQPKVGPVGNGKPKYPSILQWISLASSFIIGATNLPLAIIRYRKNKKSKTERKD